MALVEVVSVGLEIAHIVVKNHRTQHEKEEIQEKNYKNGLKSGKGV